MTVVSFEPRVYAAGRTQSNVDGSVSGRSCAKNRGTLVILIGLLAARDMAVEVRRRRS